ncbi:ATP-binding SpoIIE family protein phosphatase [Pseudoduganella buxea]|uniref:SpoIIE family protein phosphatase n=1 Tax=Pseudoduganella buxea TaxID=1949069 RepID=A0A6I3SQW1_9BURK|nr:ATP-binding SpoIIE family protein phosphatase [Pseudoduganella buxea]MTV51451.1 SpoIIE family protein phosphatase [Pseudoduganella buxea]GGB89110.1 transcriptional regulator [Pseudoduganella buxea]
METILAAQGRQTCHPVADTSQIGAARRAAADLCVRLGFGETEAGKVAIAVSEAATNILKHAQHGEILLRPLHSGAARGIEIIALDRGPGITSLPASMADGTSTAGSYGVGMGAMRRLACEFDIYSAPGKGTAVMMALWQRSSERLLDALLHGAVCLPMRGEDIPGDSWALAVDATGATVLVADGLGHGPLAAEASELACVVTMAKPEQTVAVLLEDAHAALRATRGAAAAAVRIDMLRDELRFAGIGNISAHLFAGGERRQLVSHNGIVGSNMRKVQEFPSTWARDGLLVLHSDGLTARWDLNDYYGLAACHPAVVAAVLYRDFTRGRDDVTVLVLRDRRGWIQ